MYTQVEMKMLSANYIWLIRDPAHTESTEGMETQKCCIVEQLLEFLCKQPGPQEAQTTLICPRCNLLSWMLKWQWQSHTFQLGSSHLISTLNLNRKGPAALVALLGEQGDSAPVPGAVLWFWGWQLQPSPVGMQDELQTPSAWSLLRQLLAADFVPEMASSQIPAG